MTVEIWDQVMDILKKTNACLTVGITAAWVNKDNSIVPFPEKFPEEAKILKAGLNEGLVEIANHGLTHCVVGKHLPKMFFSNRKYHREYWDWISRDIHFDHIFNALCPLICCRLLKYFSNGNGYIVCTTHAPSCPREAIYKQCRSPWQTAILMVKDWCQIQWGFNGD